MKVEPTTPTVCADDRALHYRRLLDEHARSGLSVRTFAAQHGVSAWTLYEWRRRLADSRERPVTTSRLVAVDVVGRGQPLSESVSGYEVHLPDGCRVRVPANFVAARLSELLSVLR